MAWGYVKSALTYMLLELAAHLSHDKKDGGEKRRVPVALLLVLTYGMPSLGQIIHIDSSAFLEMILIHNTTC